MDAALANAMIACLKCSSVSAAVMFSIAVAVMLILWKVDGIELCWLRQRGVELRI